MELPKRFHLCITCFHNNGNYVIKNSEKQSLDSSDLELEEKKVVRILQYLDLVSIA